MRECDRKSPLESKFILKIWNINLRNIYYNMIGCQVVCSPPNSPDFIVQMSNWRRNRRTCDCDAAAEDGWLLQLCDLACGHDVAMLQWSGHPGPGLHRSACRNGTSWPIGALQCSDQSTLTVNWPQHSGPTVSHILCLQRTLHPEDCCQADMSRQSSVCSLNIFSLISPFTTIGEEEDIWLIDDCILM